MVLMTLFATLLTLLLVTWLLDYIKRWQMPPGPFPWPVIGNLSLFRGRSYLTFIELAKKYGDVFSLKLGMTDVVVLNSLEAMKEAFQQKGVEFGSRPWTLTNDILTEGGKSIAFTGHSPTWKLQRKLFVSSLRTYASGKILEANVHESLKDIIVEFSQIEDQPVDPEDYIFKLIYNVICSASFGIRYRMDDDDFQNIMKASKDFAIVLSQGLLADIYPSLAFLPTPAKADACKQVSIFFEYFKRQVDQHRETFDPDNLRDITDHMIKAQKEAEEEGIHDIKSLTDVHIKQTIGDVFGGGTNTTIHVLRWAILYLAAHPEIQEKLAAELDSVVGRDRLSELTDREATPYMEATIHEVMRAGCVAPTSLPHATFVDTTLRGYKIPKGTWVIQNTWALHYNPAIWKDPDTFRPERFLDDDGKAMPKPSALMTFGIGRRACPGEAMARADVYLLLGGLVQNFRFSIPEGEGPPDFTPDEKGGGFLSMPVPHKVVMTRRK